jgi:hypothetical protein
MLPKPNLTRVSHDTDDESPPDMDAFLRDFGMDTPVVQAIIEEVLQVSKEATSAPPNFGARFAFKALVYGAQDTLEHLISRMDVTGIYCALFMSAQLGVLLSSDAAVTTSDDKQTFAGGFALSLCAFVANLLLTRSVHSAKGSLIRDCDIIVWARFALDFYIWGSLITLYLGCIGFMVMGYPVLRETFGEGAAVLVLVSFFAVFVFLEILLVGMGAPNRKSRNQLVSQWRADVVPQDPFKDSVAILAPILQARVERAKKMRAKMPAHFVV